MAWIESHEEVWEHHKTLKLCKILKKEDVAVVGHLLSLWHFTLRNAWRDANLEKWGDEGIESGARWKGISGEFVKALREVGLLDGFIVHGFIERAGRLVYDRLRKENERLAADKRRTSGGQSKATVPYRTVPNTTTTNNVAGATKDKVLEWFEKLWKGYPKERRVGKAASFKSFAKRVKTLEDALWVAKALSNYLDSKTVSDGFIKNASTFFANVEDYADERRDIQGSTESTPIPRTTESSSSGGSLVPAARIVTKLADYQSTPDQSKTDVS